MVGFPSSSGGGGGAAAAVGWTQIATASPSGVSAVDFTSIPQTYSDLLVVFEGVSHNNGSSASLDLRTSSDGGATFSSVATVASQSVAASALLYGGILIPGYTSDGGVAFGGADGFAASPGASSITARMIAWRADGGLDGLRIAMNAGNFDAGTITLYGR